MCRVEFPESPDWEFALRRIPTLSAEQICAAVNIALDRWEDGESVDVAEDLGARHFMMEKLSEFAAEYEEESQHAKGIQFAAVPEDPQVRSDMHSCVWVLGLTGVLQAAGFAYLEDPEAPFEFWPEGEEDPGWWPEA